MRLRLDHFASPLGGVLLVHDRDDRLRALDFEDYETRMRRLLRLHYGRVELSRGSAPPSTANALRAYFAGEFAALDAVPIATGGTPFQRDVWAALRDIPPGETTSYGSLAARIARPTGVRAVGLANGANPIAIVVPCHRVIGASGALTGFGGGLHRKQWLLEHEGALSPSARSATGVHPAPRHQQPAAPVTSR